MHIKRCARRQNMYIFASLKHALPPLPQGSIRSKKNLNNNPVVLLLIILMYLKSLFFRYANTNTNTNTF
jgi:hypothetical protein